MHQADQRYDNERYRDAERDKAAKIELQHVGAGGAEHDELAMRHIDYTGCAVNDRQAKRR